MGNLLGIGQGNNLSRILHAQAVDPLVETVAVGIAAYAPGEDQMASPSSEYSLRCCLNSIKTGCILDVPTLVGWDVGLRFFQRERKLPQIVLTSLHCGRWPESFAPPEAAAPSESQPHTMTMRSSTSVKPRRDLRPLAIGPDVKILHAWFLISQRSRLTLRLPLPLCEESERSRFAPRGEIPVISRSYCFF